MRVRQERELLIPDQVGANRRSCRPSKRLLPLSLDGPPWSVPGQRSILNKKGGRLAAFATLRLEILQNLYVLRLPAFGSLDYVELDRLAFLQAAEAIGLDRRIVDENIFPILTADEAVALRVIEPLNCSLFHGDAYSFEVM